MFLSFVTSAYAQTQGAPAPAATAPAGAPPAALLMNMAPILLILVAFFFLIIWPQQKSQKKHQKMLEALKKGDRVITRGGVHGTIVGFEDTNHLMVRIANNVDVKMVRNAVETVLREGSGT